MNSRERFHRTLVGEHPDRVPYFQEGIRADVRKAWVRQGYPQAARVLARFPYDRRIEISPILEPLPRPRRYPQSVDDLPGFERRLDPANPRRLPRGWARLQEQARQPEVVRFLNVHDGFFLTLGVYSWQRFEDVLFMLKDQPALTGRILQIQGEFAAQLADTLLTSVEIDAAIFSEPIGDNNGPLISPTDYEKFVLTSYRPLLQVLDKHGVKHRILRTYANARALIPVLLRWGLNCLWACEVQHPAMDYLALRRQFGTELRLIGGIDLDALRQGPAEIIQEIESKVPVLLAQGGYIPLADGRVRADIPYENYLAYRACLQRVIQG